VAMIFASANVPFRDLQELITVIFLLWFYATPVVYPTAMVESNDELGAVQTLQWVLAINPMTWFVRLFREALYGTVSAADGAREFVTGTQTWPDAQVLGMCTLFALATFVVGYRLFNRLALTFAKEV